MNRGDLVLKMRARYGDRLTVFRGISTIDTNGDTVEVFFHDEKQRFMIEGTIVEIGSGRHLSLPFKTLDKAFAAIDAMSAVDGSFESLEALEAAIGAVDPADEDMPSAPSAVVEAELVEPSIVTSDLIGLS